MTKAFFSKFKESLVANLPISLVSLLALILLGIEINYLLFFGCVLFLLVGITLFNNGADSFMMPLGEGIGSELSKKKKLGLMIFVAFCIGFIITFSEPDLTVLAEQVAAGSATQKWLLIGAVSLGVAIFLGLAVLKVIFKIRLSILLSISWGFLLIMGIVLYSIDPLLIALSFDTGSVTTGAISVPFILAFGVGLNAARNTGEEDDSMGIISLCSVGPIITTMLVGLIFPFASSESTHAMGFIDVLLKSFEDVALMILPIVAIFLIFQFAVLKLPKFKVYKMIVGIIFTYVGMVLFLTSVNCVYHSVASSIGSKIASSDFSWVAYPFGLFVGAVSAMAEPAVHILQKQVEHLTGGAIKGKVVMISIALGVSCAVIFAMLQTSLDFCLLYVVVPVYALNLILGFINTKTFNALAFDSGGVATGPMAVSFILPFVAGLSSGITGGFGTVALIAAFPILSIQIIGFIYRVTLWKKEKYEIERKHLKNHIVEFDWEQPYVEPEALKENVIIEFDWE